MHTRVQCARLRHIWPFRIGANRKAPHKGRARVHRVRAPCAYILRNILCKISVSSHLVSLLSHRRGLAFLRMPDALLSVIPPEVCNLAPWDFSLQTTGMKPWVLKYFETYNRRLTNWSAICVKCHWGKPKAPDDEPSFKSTSTMQMHFMRNFEGLAMCKPCRPCSWSPEEMKVEDPEFYAKVLALVNKEIGKAASKDTTSTTPVSISCTSTLSGKKHGRDDGEGSPPRQVCTPKRPRHSTLVECTPSPCASELPFLIVCSPAKSTTSSLSVEWGEG